MAGLAPSAAAMPRSGIREIMDLAWGLGEPVIGLHVGEPSFSPPPHVIEAARASYAAGDTHYVPNAGIGELRVALAGKLATVNGFSAGTDQIVVSAGAAQAIHLAFSLTVSAGDEVLVPDPGWPNYAMAIGLLQASPVCYPLRAEHGFLPDFGALEALVTERTRGLVLNTPSNPLGTVWPADVVCRAVEFAERHDIWLLSDECYDALTFDAEHVSPARFANGSNVLSVFSFSKTYAMTGLRVGYLAAPAEVAAAAAKLQEPMIACVNAPAQAAALAALRGPQDAVTRMRDTYRERRDAATGVLDQLGIDYVLPGGAFYLWVDLRSRLGSSTVSEWALKLLRDKKVAIAPGTVFGPSGEGWARLSLATDTENLIEGIQRIGAAR